MRCLIRTKACKRCGGDLSLERDKYGAYVECIQCGANWNVSDMIAPDIKAKSEHQEHKVLAAKSLRS